MARESKVADRVVFWAGVLGAFLSFIADDALLLPALILEPGSSQFLLEMVLVFAVIQLGCSWVESLRHYW